jgi:ATPase subunit of ABC transporter with duplicated ATPase domains
MPSLQLSASVTEEVISHDRWFLDRIATHILAFEGDSHVEWFEGNYQDYEADRPARTRTSRIGSSTGASMLELSAGLTDRSRPRLDLHRH